MSKEFKDRMKTQLVDVLHMLPWKILIMNHLELVITISNWIWITSLTVSKLFPTKLVNPFNDCIYLNSQICYHLSDIFAS